MEIGITAYILSISFVGFASNNKLLMPLYTSTVEESEKNRIFVDPSVVSGFKSVLHRQFLRLSLIRGIRDRKESLGDLAENVVCSVCFDEESS